MIFEVFTKTVKALRPAASDSQRVKWAWSAVALSRRRRLQFPSLLVVVITLAGCGPAPESTPGAAATNPPATAARTSSTNVATNQGQQAAASASRAKPVDSLANDVKSHADYLTFGLDEVGFLKEHEVFGQPLWKYPASLIYILLALYVAKVLDFLTNWWLRRRSTRSRTPLDDLLLNLLHGPLKLIAFVVFLNIGLDLFDWGPIAQGYLSKGLIIVVACSLTYVGLKVVDLFVGIWRQKNASGADRVFDAQLFPVISKSLKIFCVIVAVLMTASNLQINITGALASLSIGALAVGLAAQDTLANLFGAIAVYVDKPFRVGDQIRLDSVEGTVESIGLRSTRVHSLEGHHVTIPNKTVGNATIVNVTRRLNIKTEMNFGLTYETSAAQMERATRILQEIYGGHPMTFELAVAFNKFTDSTLNIQVVHWWKGTDWPAYRAGMQEINLKIKERFDGEGLNFAFPSQTIYVEDNSSRSRVDGPPRDKIL